MIQRIAKPGRSFRHALVYDFRADRLPDLVGANMAGEEPVALAAEFAEVRAMRDDLEKPVFRGSLSLAPGEHLSPDTWRALSSDYLQALGYDSAPWVSIRHRNTRLDHVHLVASRVDFSGRRVNPSFELWRGMAAVEDLCARYRLAPVSGKGLRASILRSDLLRFEQTGHVARTDLLREHIRWAARDQPPCGEFVDRLAAQGIGAGFRRDADGEPCGVSFRWGDTCFRGGSLGRSTTWRGLQRDLGVSYEPKRDAPALRRAERLSAPARRAAPAHRPDGGDASAGTLVARYRAHVVEVVRADLAHRARVAALRQTRIGEFITRTQAHRHTHLRALQELHRRSTRLETALPQLLDPRRHALGELQTLIHSCDFNGAAGWLRGTIPQLPGRGAATSRDRRDAHRVVAAAFRELKELADLRARVDATAPEQLRLERHLRRAEELDRLRRRNTALLPALPPVARTLRTFRTLETLETAAQRLAQELAPRVGRAAGAPLRWATRLAARDDEAARGR